MKISHLLAALALGAIAAMQVGPAAAATTTMTVTLNAQNGSGESGTATLTHVGPDVQVVIALTGAPAQRTRSTFIMPLPHPSAPRTV